MPSSANSRLFDATTPIKFLTRSEIPAEASTAAMASLGAGTDSVAGVGIAFQSLYALGALLFVITLLLNVLSDVIVRRFRQVY